MQAILVIIQSQDAESTLAELKLLNLPCIERIASAGSFLRQSNTALWLAVRPEQVKSVLKMLRRTCHHRTNYITSYYADSAAMIFALPLEVEVGGATLFIFDIEHYETF